MSAPKPTESQYGFVRPENEKEVGVGVELPTIGVAERESSTNGA